MVAETPSIIKIILCGVANPLDLKKFAIVLKSEGVFTIKELQEMEFVKNKEEIFVIVGQDKNVEVFDNYGFVRGQIMTEREVMSLYL